MKKSNLFIALFACCAALLSLASCTEKETEETRIPDHIEFSNLSFEAKDDLRDICSEIKIPVMLAESSWSNVTLSAENNYSWTKSFNSLQVPAASGGFGVRFTLAKEDGVLVEEYKITYVVSGEVKVIDTNGEVMSTASLSRYSGKEVVKRKDLKNFMAQLAEDMNFYYKCDQKGVLISITPSN